MKKPLTPTVFWKMGGFNLTNSILAQFEWSTLTIVPFRGAKFICSHPECKAKRMIGGSENVLWSAQCCHYMIGLSRQWVESTYLWICVHFLMLEMFWNPQTHQKLYCDIQYVWLSVSFCLALAAFDHTDLGPTSSRVPSTWEWNQTSAKGGRE